MTTLLTAWRLFEADGAERDQALQQLLHLFRRFAGFLGDLRNARRTVDTRDDERLRGTERKPPKICPG
jgi:hypothetical protein